MARTSSNLPFDCVLSGFARIDLHGSGDDHRYAVEQAAFLFTELFESLQRWRDRSAGRRSAADDEALRLHFEQWVAGADQVVLPEVQRLEATEGFNCVSNSDNLRAFIGRARDILRDWPTPTTQANVAFRDTELSDEGSRAFHEAISGGRAKVKFKTPPAPKA